MRKILIYCIGIGLVAILSGCIMQRGLSQNELFAKKQECANYKENVLKVIKELSDERLQESFYELDQLFYSPTKNTCIYSYRWVSRQNNFTQKNILDYFVVDYLSQDVIFETNAGYVLNSGAIEEYDSKINELKGE